MPQNELAEAIENLKEAIRVEFAPLIKWMQWLLDKLIGETNE